MLWRPDAAQPAMLTIDSATTEWPAGNAAIRWPESVPFASGAEYSLQLSTRSEPASIRLITLQSPPPDLIDLAETLIRNGCQPQLEWLLESHPPA